MASSANMLQDNTKAMAIWQFRISTAIALLYNMYCRHVASVAIPKWDEKMVGSQGTGGAFFWYLAEEGIRCRTCGNSCLRRLLGIPCKGLFLIIRNTKLEMANTQHTQRKQIHRTKQGVSDLRIILLFRRKVLNKSIEIFEKAIHPSVTYHFELSL